MGGESVKGRENGSRGGGRKKNLEGIRFSRGIELEEWLGFYN